MPDKQLSMKSPRFVKFYKARGRKRNHHGNNNVVFELSIYKSDELISDEVNFILCHY